MKLRKFWGWGYMDEVLTNQEESSIESRILQNFNVDKVDTLAIPQVKDIELPTSRITIPASLKTFLSDDTHERLNHAYGKSFPDIARALLREFPSPPDLVAFPDTENDLKNIVDWADENCIAVIPYGGGSSVCGGVETSVGEDYKGVISLDLRNLNKVLEIDKDSRSARIQAGILGPDLENTLREHNLTMRHYPQSFELSTLGGWIATRSGGHFATLYTHIDDFVQSTRMVTPSGIIESRRLPGSGAGPSPDRFAIGSEGILGVITEAWMRLQDRPTFRASTSVEFTDYKKALNATRLISQSGLFPANCRLLDSNEAMVNGAGDGSVHVLMLSFESADHDVQPWLERALEIAESEGGEFNVPKSTDKESHRKGSSGTWRNSFIKAPYFREGFVRRGIVQDTFETAITWDKAYDFIEEAKKRSAQAIKEISGKEALVTCRITHTYPDGLAPYFTYGAYATPSTMLDVWKDIKLATNEICVSLGGTITHHHAVGRDHRPNGYDQQRTEGFKNILNSVKLTTDPNGIMNPGVLIDPHGKKIKNWMTAK
jgi:alkyldihydroxyacetonephosphate synthase